jgi:hypothetical protein
MTMDKYPQDITIHTHTHDKKIIPSDHPYTLVGMDLPYTHTMGMSHPYPQKLNFYQNGTLYKCQLYPPK